MPNAFDIANFPTTEPAQLVAGDRAMWKRTDLGADYPPASYTLKYSARLEGSGATEITFTAAGSGSDFIVEIAAATTAAWAPGRYHWQAYIIRTSDSQRITVDSGTFTIKANRDEATTDPRTHAKKVLDAIEAVLEGRATKDQESVTIAGRTLQRTPLPDLIALRTEYRMEVRAEEAKEQLAQTGFDPRRVGVRFKRV